MLRIYIKSAIRVLIRNRSITLINVAGLAIGMSIFIMIALYVGNELTNDSYHQKLDRIARLETSEFVALPMVIKKMIGNDIAGVEKVVRLSYMLNTGYFRQGENTFKVNDLLVADAEVFEVFSFKLIKGDSATALIEPHSLVISESNARKFFGEEDPMGKTLRYNNTFNFVITGVMKDLPLHSSIWAGMITNVDLFNEMGNINYLDDYNDWSHYVFILLSPGSSMADTRLQIHNKLNREIQAIINQSDYVIDFRLTPMKSLYLSKGIQADSLQHGSRKLITIYIAIGFFILLIAVVNFINLSNAASFKRNREIGLKKLVGAGKGSLLLQLLIESVLLSFISLIVALLLFELLYPIFNKVTLATISSQGLFNIKSLLFCLGLALITGLAAGIYPALYLLKFKPVYILKGSLESSKAGIYTRRLLLMFQFAISVVLIIAAWVIYNQMYYAKSMDLGFDKEHIVYFSGRGSIQKHYPAFSEALMQVSGVQQIGITSAMPGYSNMNWGPKVDGIDRRFDAICCDPDFITMLDLKITEGRNFIKGSSMDLNKAYIVNETFVKQFELQSPLGISVREGKIVGVVKDFNYQPANATIGPLAMVYMPEIAKIISVRISPHQVPQTIKAIERVWNSFDSGFPFEYNFYDEAYDRLYRKEERLFNLFGYFSLLAVIIACMGIAGLALYTARIKTREISIRRVFGAPQSAIVSLMFNEFMVWLLLAGIIAWPVAYYIMNEWLSQFAYHVTIKWWIFVVATILAALLALSVVMFHAIRIIRSNPSVVFRNE